MGAGLVMNYSIMIGVCKWHNYVKGIILKGGFVQPTNFLVVLVKKNAIMAAC